MGKRKVYRDAGTGRFVKKSKVKRDPQRTVTETRPSRRRKMPLSWLMSKAGILIITSSSLAAGESPRFVDDDAPPSGDGLTWRTAYRFLQDALTEAEAKPGITEIRIAQGTYKPDQDEKGSVVPGDPSASFELIDGVALRGGFAGLGFPDPDEQDVNRFITVLTGDLLSNDGPGFSGYGDNSLNVVSAVATGLQASVDGLTIQGGNATGSGFPNGHGGALVVDDPMHTMNITIARCRFEVNAAAQNGGALATRGGTIEVIDSAFTQNTVTTAGFGQCDGGGLYADNSILNVSNCEFQGNVSIEGGGGMSVVATTLHLANSLFDDNCACHADGSAAGGGLRIRNGSAVVVGCTFRNNRAMAPSSGSFGIGGGCANEDANSIFVNCAFIGNSAEVAGGLLFIGPGVQRTFSSLFAGNEAVGAAQGYGGGIAVRQHQAGTNLDAAIGNCLFVRNATDGTGGGISYTNNVGASALTISNSVVWDNEPDNLDAEANGDATILMLYNDIEGGWDGDGEGNISIDPLFRDADGNDGDPKTVDDNDYRLQPGSPCIDSGHNPSLPNDEFDIDEDGMTKEPLPLDLDGAVRVVDDNCVTDTGISGTLGAVVDMGPFEFHGSSCDLDSSGDVGVVDLLILLASWGACDRPPVACPADFNRDGSVGLAEFVLLLDNWGPVG